jgi:hypothetical protein
VCQEPSGTNMRREKKKNNQAPGANLAASASGRQELLGFGAESRKDGREPPRVAVVFNPTPARPLVFFPGRWDGRDDHGVPLRSHCSLPPATAELCIAKTALEWPAKALEPLCRSLVPLGSLRNQCGTADATLRQACRGSDSALSCSTLAI